MPGGYTLHMSQVVKAKRKQNDEGVTMDFKFTKHLWKRGLSMALSAAMAVTLLPAVSSSAATLSETASQKPKIFKAGSVPATADTITYDEPYAAGTAGSEKFRIPCLITLENGDLLSVVDARWTTVKDGGGLDTMASVSSDGGKTWNYSFPLFFPDSDGYIGTPIADPRSSKATTIIDPGIVEGPDGTIYCFVDVNPTNCTTLFKKITTGTGFVTVNNKRYLALTDEYGNVDIEPTDEDSNLTYYPYYVDDFDEDGYAKIRRRDNGDALDYVVDEWYNIYRVDENGVYRDDLTQKQIVDDSGAINENVDIQQNCYYENSKFHVYRIGYIWLLTSKDHGRTWEAPRNINDQVKRHTGEKAILVSPGRGLTTSDGTIVIGFYNSHDEEENSSLVWSDDNGETWKRSNDVPGSEDEGFETSENEIVELSDGTLRMFVRNYNGKICYADAVRNEQGDYEFSTLIQTEFSAYARCNLTAITYSKKIDGKQVVLLACPTGGNRGNGKIFTVLINEDEEHTMELANEFAIPEAVGNNAFAYSCLTELDDGSLALLWEPNSANTMNFSKFDIGDVVPYEFDVVNVELSKGETYTRNYNRKNASGITVPADEEIVEISLTDNGISIKALVDRGYTEAVIDNQRYKINIIDNTIALSVGATYEITDVETDPGSVASDIVTVATEPTQTGYFYSHASNVNNSITAFSSERESGKRLSEAEFTFVASGDQWNIYNEYTKQYLAVTGAAEYFGNSPVNMTVTKETDSDKFTITDGTRYALFYAGGGMIFDAAKPPLAANLDTKLTLLEKKLVISADDPIPGYKTVSSLTDGKKYLIAYLYDNNAIVLYPENGQTNQTKLVKPLPTYKVTVTAEQVGKSSVTIDGEEYTFRVLAGDCKHEKTVRKGAVKAGCFTEGYEGDLYCANPDCGIFLEKGDVIPAFGDHDWDEGKITKDVTETENGEKVYTCKHDSFHTKTETIYASVYAAMRQEYREADEVLKNMYGLYTEETIEALENVYNKYKEVLEDKGASYSQMNEVTAAFQAAKAALTKKQVDDLKAELRTACEEAEPDYRAKETNLGTAWTEFMKAYIAATAFSDDANEEELWLLIHTLDTARTDLLAARELSNAKTALQNAVQNAKSKYDAGKDNYTLATWTPFAAAYQAASNPPANADAAALKKLLDALTTAQKALKDVELQKGAKAIDAAGTYEVTDVAKKEVTLITGKDIQSVTIPAEIRVNGITCKVVAIGSNAFKNAKKVKKVIIGGNVTSIGSQAFSGCKKLNSITLGANVTKIDKKAFFKSKKLKTVTLQGATVPSIGKQSFKDTASKVTVKAPKISKAQRKKLLSKMKSAGKISKKSVIR